MLNMFGRDYEELGSSDKGLILRNSGKVKILWGKKLIDLLDSNGNLNVKLLKLIKQVSSESDIVLDGFYYYNKELIAKVGDEIVKLTPDYGTTYVSFLIDLKEVTDKQKYIALLNIGFIYKTESDLNVYPTNGIIYILDKQQLYIVTDGNLTKYIALIPNPFNKLFIISKLDDKLDGSLVITGVGSHTGLKFDTLRIYSNNDNISTFNSSNNILFRINDKKVVNFTLLGIETEGIKSVNADENIGYRIRNNNGKYILDIDEINVRSLKNIIRGHDNKVYSERYIIDKAVVETKAYNNINYPSSAYRDGFLHTNYTYDNSLVPERTNIKALDNIKISVVRDSSDIKSSQDINSNETRKLVSISLKVIKCLFNFLGSNYIELSDTNERIYGYLSPINTITYSNGTSRPQYTIKDFIFQTTSSNGTLIYKNYPYYGIIMYDKLPYGSINGEYKYFLRVATATPNTINLQDTIDNFEYYLLDKELPELLKEETMYICSDETNLNNSRLLYNFDDSEITLSQNNNNYTLSEKCRDNLDIHFKLGNISQYKTNNYNSSNNYGIFSNLNCFIGAEFREPLKHKALVTKNIGGQLTQDVDEIKTEVEYYHLPRYSTDLCNEVNKKFLEKSDDNDEIILPRKLIPKIVLEDFTNINYTSELINGQTEYTNIYELCNTSNSDTVTLYNGKLILLKLKANSNKSSIRIYKTVEVLGQSLVLPFYYKIKLDGNHIKEGTDFDLNTVLLLKFIKDDVNDSDSYFDYLCGNKKQRILNLRILNFTLLGLGPYNSGHVTYLITNYELYVGDLLYIKLDATGALSTDTILIKYDISSNTRISILITGPTIDKIEDNSVVGILINSIGSNNSNGTAIIVSYTPKITTTTS